MKWSWNSITFFWGCLFVSALLFASCATQQGYQGAGVGAATGATAGILLDSHNRWRGAVIGGGLGAALGGALTDRTVLNNRCPAPYRQGYNSRNSVARGAIIGGATGAAAGALLDRDNRWRGSLIGGALGGIFGESISNINSRPSIPVLNP